MQVQIGNTVYNLTEGEPLKIQAGQTIRVFYTFNYKVAEETSVPLWASLYTRTLGITNRVGSAQTKLLLTLERAADWQVYQGTADVVVKSTVPAGVYGLMVELPGFEDGIEQIENCIEVAAAPGMTDWLGPMLMIGVMGVMMRMTAGAGEGMA